MLIFCVTDAGNDEKRPEYDIKVAREISQSLPGRGRITSVCDNDLNRVATASEEAKIDRPGQ